MDLKKTAENINILADFCGVRDIEELRQNALKENMDLKKRMFSFYSAGVFQRAVTRPQQAI